MVQELQAEALIVAYNSLVRITLVALVAVASLIGCSKSAAPVAPSDTTGQAAQATQTTTAPKKPQTPLDQVGIPVYPGSQKVTIKLGKQAKNGSHTVYAEYSTTDSADKVAEFYQNKLGLMTSQPPGTKLHQLVGKTPKGIFTQILTEPDGANTKIQIYFVVPAKS